MFCFRQISCVSGAEFGLPSDLGYEAERRWAPRAPHGNVSTGLWWSCRGVVPTPRPTRNSDFTSYFDIDFKYDAHAG